MPQNYFISRMFGLFWSGGAILAGSIRLTGFLGTLGSFCSNRITHRHYSVLHGRYDTLYVKPTGAPEYGVAILPGLQVC